MEVIMAIDYVASHCKVHGNGTREFDKDVIKRSSLVIVLKLTFTSLFVCNMLDLTCNLVCF